MAPKSSKPKKIATGDDAWELDCELGNSEAHAVPAPGDLEALVDESLGMQAISIRLPRELIHAYKLIAAHHGVGYQPLMRDILQRFVPEGLSEVLRHHEGRVEQLPESFRKAA